MGLLGRQLKLERESEDSLLLALSALTFTISLFAGYQEGGIGALVSLPLFGIEFHLISTPLWIFSGLLCMFCLQQLFHKIWTHGVWLIGIYWLTAIGTILLFVMFDHGYVWFVASLILWMIVKSSMGVRLSDSEEKDGADKSEIGLSANPEFGNQ